MFVVITFEINTERSTPYNSLPPIMADDMTQFWAFLSTVYSYSAEPIIILYYAIWGSRKLKDTKD